MQRVLFFVLSIAQRAISRRLLAWYHSRSGRSVSGKRESRKRRRSRVQKTYLMGLLASVVTVLDHFEKKIGFGQVEVMLREDEFKTYADAEQQKEDLVARINDLNAALK